MQKKKKKKKTWGENIWIEERLIRFMQSDMSNQLAERERDESLRKLVRKKSFRELF